VNLTAEARTLQGLGHPARIKLLKLVASRDSTFGELRKATGLSDGKAFYHLRFLTAHKLIDAETRGRGARYHLTDTGRKSLPLVQQLS